jgi:hypothetical protein
MTERLNALQEQAQRIERLGMDGGPETRTRIEAIERSATRHGLPLIYDKKKRPFGVGDQRCPGATQAIQLLFARLGETWGIGAYADLSAVAHSSLAAFAYQKSPLLDSEENPISPPPTSGQIPFERAVVIALTAYDEAVRRYLTLFGWSLAPWQEFLSAAHARLRFLLDVPAGQMDIVQVGHED